MFGVLQQMAVILLTHTRTALLTGSLTQSEWDNRVGHRVKISCAGINNRGRQETHKEYRARYWPGFVTIDKSRAITISVTVSVSTQQWPWQPPQSNRELCHGTAEQQRALPLSPAFHPNHLVYITHPSCLRKQGWISKSPGCCCGGEEPDIIWPLSLTRLLPELSQLKAKGCKSVTGFYDWPFLCTARGSSHAEPQGIFALYVFCVLRLCRNAQRGQRGWTGAFNSMHR